jgi:3-isopropylmalate/(R)-2-methylmalate dehydratase small subunit
MQPFIRVRGPAAAMPAANIDTDVIMPKQFLKGIDRSGLDRGLFHDLRFDGHGRERLDFVLNQPRWRNAAFLVVGPNFGCGSSREHAVWGLMQYGIRALIGTSFAGIFFDNCARNGLLAITLDAAMHAEVSRAAADAEHCELDVDLDRHIITGPALEIGFAIDPMRRDALLTGLDAIGQTLLARDEIAAFEQRYLRETPWLS